MARAFTKTGGGAIQDIWAGARRTHEELAQAAFADPHPDLARDGIKAGQWPGAPHDELPPNCPVQVIGRDSAQNVWCKSATGDLVMIEKWDMATISKLFSPFINFAFWAWPAFGKSKVTDEHGNTQEILQVKRIERDKLFTCLSNEASKPGKPIFDPSKQHRGRGAWKTSNNEFIWHSGKYLWRSVNGRLQNVPPGQIEEFLYTRQAPIIEPWEGPITQEQSPMRRIFREMRTWNWERPYLDPILVAGWIGTAFAGAANDVRPVIFTTGGFGTGKSTMQGLIRGVLRSIVFTAENTTAAGIYQQMKHDALPVMVDELESKASSDVATNIIELARIAYSGGRAARGGSDHHGTTFTLYCPFFFSAINPPPMGNQDKSRMAVLNLSRLTPRSGEGRPQLISNETDGRMILRQVMDGWPKYSVDGKNWWWNLLASLKGIDSRSIDTYGTLLAMAEMLLGHEELEAAGLPVTDEAHLAEVINEATASERAERLDNWHSCLNHLMACTIDSWRDGKKPTIGGVMDELSYGNLDGDVMIAREKLELVNLGCKAKGYTGQPSDGPFLCVPADGPQINKLFAGTEFKQGVWNNALKQAPADIVVRDRVRQVVKINGVAKRCLLVDMKAFAKYAEKQ
jgi:hypothetical protein